MPRPGIVQNSRKRVLRVWTRDLQIFSLTLSQLSYLGRDASIENNVNYYMALSHKDWELPNARIWLAEIDIDRGLDFPI